MNLMLETDGRYSSCPTIWFHQRWLGRQAGHPLDMIIKANKIASSSPRSRWLSKLVIAAVPKIGLSLVKC